MIKSLNTTSIYTYAEDASKQHLTNIIMDYSVYKNGTIVVKYDDVADAMYEITSRTSPFFAKYAVDKLLKKGILELVYNEQVRLTNAVPFFRKTLHGRTTMMINITNFSTMREDGTINIASNTLYALLLSAAFTLELDSMIESYVKDVYVMYTRMFANIIANLSYMDNIKKEKIQYLACNFFYYQVYGPTRAFNNPMKEKLRYNSIENIKALENKIPLYGDESGYTTLEIFIDNLVKIFPEMKKLSFKNFIDRWTLSYGSSTIFACEYIPYFFYMVISAACLSPVVNINKISTEVAVNLTSVYKRIENAVNNMIDL